MANFKVKNGIDAGGAINKVTITVPATGSTLTIADGKTLTVSNTITFTATDGSTLNIGSGGTLGSAAYTATSAYLASGVTSLPNVTSVNGTTIPSSKTLVVTTDIGTSVQAYDADLAAIAALTGTAGFLKTNGSGTWSVDTTTYATSGANSNITSLSGLTTALSVSQGGTGTGTAGITALNNITGYTASGATGTTSTNLVFSGTPTIVTPVIDSISASAATGINPSLYGNTTTGTISVGSGLTTGTINIATGGSSTNAINVGNTNTTVTINGNLDVKGTTTTIESTTVTVTDKNLELGKVASPTDSTADGGGLTLKGATDKTLNWVNATGSWTSSENVDLASGKTYKINGTTVLSGSALGSGITGSSLTSVGTIGTGTWQGTVVGATYGGTGVNNGSNIITLAGNLTTSGANALTLTTTGATNVTLPTTGTLVNTAVTSLSSLATVGTIGSGTWQGSVIGATYGGTGVNNGSSTITLGGSLTLSGAYTTALTVTGNTAVTLPTSGTLATTTGAGSVLGASANAVTVSANTATTIDTIAMNAFTTAKYIVSIKQGSKIRSSEVIVQSNGTTGVDFSEQSIIETGGAMAGVSVDASNSSTNCILTVTITDAVTTNATVKFNKIVL